MSVKLLTKHHFEFLSLKGGCTGSSESTLVKMPHCWKSHVVAQIVSHLSYHDATDFHANNSDLIFCIQFQIDLTVFKMTTMEAKLVVCSGSTLLVYVPQKDVMLIWVQLAVASSNLPNFLNLVVSFFCVVGQSSQCIVPRDQVTQSTTRQQPGRRSTG